MLFFFFLTSREKEILRFIHLIQYFVYYDLSFSENAALEGRCGIELSPAGKQQQYLDEIVPALGARFSSYPRDESANPLADLVLMKLSCSRFHLPGNLAEAEENLAFKNR